MTSCNKSCNKGPGYKSPMDAFTSGPREKILFVTTINPRQGGSDALVVVNVDPDSPDYGSIISRLSMPQPNDELHHFGWNACSSCHTDSSKVRNKLILPCLNSNRVYIVDTGDISKLTISETIDNLLDQWKVSAPHTVHCLPDNEVAISCMGDENGNGKGSIVLIDGSSFKVKNFWSNDFVPFGYDFWYQPRFNVLVSSEWGSPKAWKKGFDLTDVVTNKQYGSRLHFYNWSTRELVQSLDLGEDGLLPLEVRFLHNPEKCHGFVGCALSSSIFHFYQDQNNKWKADKVIQVESKKVTNWIMDEMPGVITDIILSLDDKYLYFSNWIQGDVRQYDISDPFNPFLVASIFVGGSLCNDTRIGIIESEKSSNQSMDRHAIRGIKVRGGPQMLQLSLDGRRLYVTNSLFSAWDKQFYPEIIEKGSLMVRIDVDVDKKRLILNQDFIIDFGKEPNGPMLAHEMRYPGGDCTSDIWI